MAGAEKIAARRGAWICFADECGQTLRPLNADSWAPREATPIVAVTATGNARCRWSGWSVIGGTGDPWPVAGPLAEQRVVGGPVGGHR